MTRGGRGACVCPIPFGTRAKGDGSVGTGAGAACCAGGAWGAAHHRASCIPKRGTQPGRCTLSGFVHCREGRRRGLLHQIRRRAFSVNERTNAQRPFMCTPALLALKAEGPRMHQADSRAAQGSQGSRRMHEADLRAARAMRGSIHASPSRTRKRPRCLWHAPSYWAMSCSTSSRVAR